MAVPFCVALKEKRTSVSVITALGHKDDTTAREAAYLISKHTRERACAVVGIHLENITEREIKEIVKNASAAIEEVKLLLG